MSKREEDFVRWAKKRTHEELKEKFSLSIEKTKKKTTNREQERKCSAKVESRKTKNEIDWELKRTTNVVLMENNDLSTIYKHVSHRKRPKDPKYFELKWKKKVEKLVWAKWFFLPRICKWNRWSSSSSFEKMSTNGQVAKAMKIGPRKVRGTTKRIFTINEKTFWLFYLREIRNDRTEKQNDALTFVFSSIFTLERSKRWTRRSWIAWRLKLSSTFVNGQIHRWTKQTKNNMRKAKNQFIRSEIMNEIEFDQHFCFAFFFIWKCKETEETLIHFLFAQ